MNNQSNNQVLVLNGPGTSSEPGLHADRLKKRCAALCEQLGLRMDFRQTDDAGDMVFWVAEDSAKFDALIINPGSMDSPDTYGAALRSAMTSVAHLGRPTVEVHPGNIFAVPHDEAMPLPGPEGRTGLVCGLGDNSYLVGIRSVAGRLQTAS